MFVETRKDGEAQAKPDAVSQLLLRAADEMERRGWIRGELCSAEGVCLLGALFFSCPISHELTVAKAQERLEKFLGTASVPWNDLYCRSKEEAVAALRGAAAL